jgi:hypothetical protein
MWRRTRPGSYDQARKVAGRCTNINARLDAYSYLYYRYKFQVDSVVGPSLKKARHESFDPFGVK